MVTPTSTSPLGHPRWRPGPWPPPVAGLQMLQCPGHTDIGGCGALLCAGPSRHRRPTHRPMVPGGQACPHTETRLQGPEHQGSPQADPFFLSALHPPCRFHPQPGGKKAAAAPVITSAPRDSGGLSPTRTPSQEVGKAPNPLIPHVPPPTPWRDLGNTVLMNETSRRKARRCVTRNRKRPEQGHLQRQNMGDTQAAPGHDSGRAALSRGCPRLC